MVIVPGENFFDIQVTPHEMELLARVFSLSIDPQTQDVIRAVNRDDFCGAQDMVKDILATKRMGRLVSEFVLPF